MVKTVLIAEDDSASRDFLAIALEARGHRVEVAANGVQALEAMTQQAFDVVILDYHMPGIDGAEAAKTMVSGGQGVALPTLIAVTADTRGLREACGSNNPFTAVVAKPVDLEKLMTIVETSGNSSSAQMAVFPTAQTSQPPVKTIQQPPDPLAPAGRTIQGFQNGVPRPTAEKAAPEPEATQKPSEIRSQSPDQARIAARRAAQRVEQPFAPGKPAATGDLQTSQKSNQPLAHNKQNAPNNDKRNPHGIDPLSLQAPLSQSALDEPVPFSSPSHPGNIAAGQSARAQPTQQLHTGNVISVHKPSSDQAHIFSEHHLGTALVLPRRGLPDTTMAKVQERFYTGTDRPADTLVIAGDIKPEDVRRERAQGMGHLLPVIDMTEQYGREADAVLIHNDSDERDQVRWVIDTFKENRDRLASSIVSSHDKDMRLLSCLYVSGHTLKAIRSGDERHGYHYNRLLPVGEVAEAAVRMHTRGFLDHHFVDRVHSCGQCGSRRLNVREECPSCRSPHIKEVALLHHFRCAWQGPETDARVGDDLVCPKCRQELLHYGSEYDKPGKVHHCQSCGESHAEPDIGFICYDCGSHADALTMHTDDIYDYTLTDNARDLLLSGLTDRANALGPAVRAALPLSVAKKVDRMLSREGANTVMTLAEIRYSRGPQIIAKKGIKIFNSMRDLYSDALSGVIKDYGIVHRGRDCDYLIVEGVNVEQFQAIGTRLATRAEQGLAIPLGSEFTLYSARDLVGDAA